MASRHKSKVALGATVAGVVLSCRCHKKSPPNFGGLFLFPKLKSEDSIDFVLVNMSFPPTQ
jgi:hypothetical protein